MTPAHERAPAPGDAAGFGARWRAQWANHTTTRPRRPCGRARCLCRHNSISPVFPSHPGRRVTVVGKYDALDRFFAEVEDDDLYLSFDQVEEILGSLLPHSATRHAAWWSSSQYHAVWAHHGWRASPDLRGRRVRFRRVGEAKRALSDIAPVEARQAVEGVRLILLGCVKTKLTRAARARDLYISSLWEKRRAYAEASGQPWRILSAEHGLLHPDTVIEPYDRHLGSQTAAYQSSWSREVAHALFEELGRLGLSWVEVHASAPYVERVRPMLESAGITVDWPFEGLRQGEHLAWYTGSRQQSEPPDERSTLERSAPEWPTMVRVERIDGFEYRWPDATERFDFGWDGTVSFRGRTYGFRHAVGHRVVYGKDRVHTVTFLDGAPTVEGVAADDYLHSQALLSLIKRRDGAMARSTSEVPAGYERFLVVDHRSEIDAPYSRTGLAVKIRFDDVTAWASHALLRRQPTKERPAGKSPIPMEEPPDLDQEDSFPEEPLGAEEEPLDLEEKRAIAGRLIQFGETADYSTSPPGTISFTPIPEANDLLVSEPFAFLVAVICDYQIPAERAWAVPYHLRQRLGHLNPIRILTEPERVAEAVATRPSLHRYVQRVPEFIVEAARIVIQEYGGDASRIWGDEPTAAQLQARLRRFPGISQKKAAMAVEILERDLGVPVREMTGSDIAYDVHVRRVFLRTGLVEVDDQDHMVSTARIIHPQRPGALDAPAWVIGRTWCRPRDPDCPMCVLDDVCAHRIAMGDPVRGA